MKTFEQSLEELVKMTVHPVDSSDFEIIQETTTNPRREMLGTQYILKHKATGKCAVVETVDHEEWRDGLWVCEECEVERIISYKVKELN